MLYLLLLRLFRLYLEILSKMQYIMNVFWSIVVLCTRFLVEFPCLDQIQSLIAVQLEHVCSVMSMCLKSPRELYWERIKTCHYAK